MPMYDYRCKNCGHKFEELVFSCCDADKEIICPECNHKNAERLLSAPAIRTGGSDSGGHSFPACNPGSGFS
ncbi:MAG: zinc ribbon domain-containing protein [Candidatus Neomarinimicrobiota bacterium]